MRIIYLTLVGLLLILPGCKRDEGDRVRAGTATTEQIQDQRDQYVRSVEAKLDEFDQKFDGLESRAAAATEPAKDSLNKAVDSLRAERRNVDQKLDDLKKVSVDSWTTMKSEVDMAVAALERSYERVSAGHETVPAAKP